MVSYIVLYFHHAQLSGICRWVYLDPDRRQLFDNNDEFSLLLDERINP